jgi:hypothetical protein
MPPVILGQEKDQQQRYDNHFEPAVIVFTEPVDQIIFLFFQQFATVTVVRLVFGFMY